MNAVDFTLDADVVELNRLPRLVVPGEPNRAIDTPGRIR